MEADRDWVAGITGGEVTRFERTATGRSRATWLVDVKRPDGEILELVLRRDTGDGPLSGTEISLTREAAVYRALHGTGVAIPRLLDVSPDGEALLVERATGSEDLAPLSAEEQGDVMDSFVSQLVALHHVEPANLDLPGFARPRTPEEHATADLDLWQRVFDGHVTRPSPLWRFVFAWLRQRAPIVVERTVLCHGDVGPGNFLFSGGEVTAVLDWEFAHVGDPMDDIAWLTIRGHHLFDAGDPVTQLRRYQDLSGLKIDPDRVRYYQAFVLLRMAVACLVALDRRARSVDASTYLCLLPILSTLVTRLIADLEGIELVPAAIPAPGDATPRGEVLEVIGSNLGNVMLPELQTTEARSRAMGTVALLAHLQTADRLAPALEDDDIDELAALLGRRPPSSAEGLAALETAVAADPAADLSDRLGYFARQADRQVALWPMVAAIAQKPLPPVVIP